MNLILVKGDHSKGDKSYAQESKYVFEEFDSFRRN